MNRSRLILTLVFFLSRSLELWAQKPGCYHSFDANGNDVLILPVLGTNRSKTVHFEGIPIYPGGPTIYFHVVTVFPDGHVRDDAYSGIDKQTLIEVYGQMNCAIVPPLPPSSSVRAAARAAASA